MKSGQRRRVGGRGTGRRDATTGRGEKSLKNRDRIQVGRVAGSGAQSGTAERKLPAGGSVRSVAEKVEAQQGVVIEHPERPAEHGFAVSLGIPRDSNARLNVVPVGLDAFL